MQYACLKAFPLPASLAKLPRETRAAWKTRLGPVKYAKVLAWKRDHRYHPHLSRHRYGTNVRDRFGLDYTQKALGQTSAKAAQIYAALSLQKAIEAVPAIG